MNHKITHDGIIHHPLGGGSYVFSEKYSEFLASQIKKPYVNISIGAQPNSSPHFGTLVVFNLAYALASQLNAKTDKKAQVTFEVVDTAPTSTEIIKGISYQKSLRFSRESDNNLIEYESLLSHLQNITDVTYKIRKQNEFNSNPNIGSLLTKIVENKDILGPILNPKNGTLRMRVACPDCGLTDKNGIKNQYIKSGVISQCPTHGEHFASFIEDSNKFEYNTPLRNLIRAIIYGKDNQNNDTNSEWIRVTGSDYAGYYQEKMLYKTAALLGIHANHLPEIIYAPLITDWSGAKLSKSLYVKKGAYTDIPAYLVNFKEFKKTLGMDGVTKMFNEVDNWVSNPYKLFRNYSVYYFMNEVFNEK